MKMIAFAVEEAERELFRRFCGDYGIELTMLTEKPSLENAHLTEGMDCINVVSDVVLTPRLWDIYREKGIRLGVTRTIGMEHMNREYAESIGIGIRNITYSPASVADSAVMMMLMSLRHVKAAMNRYVGQDYTMAGLRGREMHNMTVGIIGAGRIGITTAKELVGFGCRILYWNRTEKPELRGVAEYVPLNELLAESDIVSVHLALNGQTRHFIDAAAIERMKDGAVLVNTARGPLVDSEALIEALETGKLGGAALDVFDGDRSIYYRDHKNRVLGHRQMAILNAMPNVLMLPHMAYFTDQAVEDMVHNSLIAACEYFREEKSC